MKIDPVSSILFCFVCLKSEGEDPYTCPKLRILCGLLVPSLCNDGARRDWDKRAVGFYLILFYKDRGSVAIGRGYQEVIVGDGCLKRGGEGGELLSSRFFLLALGEFTPWGKN